MYASSQRATPKHRNIFTLRSTDQGTFFPMPIDTRTTGQKKINPRLAQIFFLNLLWNA
jgi:hypothetical protein